MDIGILLTYSIVSLFAYVAGIYFHSKIIKVSLKDKEMSWQLDVIYSCVKIFVNTFAYFLGNVWTQSPTFRVMSEHSCLLFGQCLNTVTYL